MSNKINKIDLTLLKKMVGELESSLATGEGLGTTEGNKNEYIIEMSKAAGLCAGLIQEAAMLIGDVQATIMSVQNPSPAAKGDIFDKLLGSLKGSGNGGISN